MSLAPTVDSPRRTPRIVIASAVVLGLLAVPATAAHAASYPPLIAFDDRNGGPGTTAVFLARPGFPGSDHLQIAGASDPAWSPGGDRLAYLVVNDSTDVATLRIGDRYGRTAHTLISGPDRTLGTSASVDGPLAWSPNGREIAYLCDLSSPDGSTTLAQLCTVDVTTGTREVITRSSTFPGLANGFQQYQRLSWTPNGRTVVGTVFHQVTCTDPPVGPFPPSVCGYPAIATISADTGASDELTGDGVHAVTPDLAPDGHHIVYYDESVGVRVMSSNGGGAHTIVTNKTLFGGALADDAFPTWSPDGREVLFTKYATGNAPGTGYAQLFTIDADGTGAPDQLTHSAFDAFDAVWTGVRTTCTVPNLKGRTIAQAQTALRRAACALGTIAGPRTDRAHRHVTAQTIKANTERASGTKVGITVK